MELKISHNFQDETIEAKALWWQSLTLEERMDLFVEFTDLILELNPEIVEAGRAQPVAGRICILKQE